ncbi:MAG: hypothetical protein CVU04_04715, partial [Bacteroidetes bacterium HGW-Bacteroidetes-20]
MSSPNFQLGKLIQNTKYFGQINGDVQFEGVSEPFFGEFPFLPSIVAKIDLFASQFDICKYPLRNIVAHGTYEKDLYIGQVSSDDPNAFFDFDGTVDLRNQIPRYKTTLTLENLVLGNIFKNFNHYVDTLNPKAIDNIVQFTQNRPNFTLSLHSLESEIKGNSLENFTGFIAANSIIMSENEKTAVCDWLRLNSILTQNNVRNFMLKGSIFNANLTTNYALESIFDSLQNIANFYLPSLFDKTDSSDKIKIKHDIEQNHFFNLSLETFDTRNLLDLLVPGLRITPNSLMYVYLGTDRTQDTISITSDKVRWGNLFTISQISIHGKLDSQDAFDLSFHADSLIYYQDKKPLNFTNISLNSQTINQKTSYLFSWISPDTLNLRNTSFVKGFADFSNIADIFIKLEDANLFIRNSIWKVNGLNEIHFKKNRIEVDNFVLQSKMGVIDIAGIYSKKYNERLD